MLSLALHLIQEWQTAFVRGVWHVTERIDEEWHNTPGDMAAPEWHGPGSGRGSTCFHGDSTSIPTSQYNLTHSPFIPYGVSNTS